MADAELEVVRRAFAELTGLCEDATLIASAGQGAQSLDGGRLNLRRLSLMMDGIRRRLVILERRLQ